mmetsp:Transcript_37409/g.120889  ORF Transcript_37409/g.120889 Transcript_37409/m.120889 type:complete len:214 (-) Transcript_37409:17-658(-)
MHATCYRETNAGRPPDPRAARGAHARSGADPAVDYGLEPRDTRWYRLYAKDGARDFTYTIYITGTSLICLGHTCHEARSLLLLNLHALVSLAHRHRSLLLGEPQPLELLRRHELPVHPALQVGRRQVPACVNLHAVLLQAAHVLRLELRALSEVVEWEASLVWRLRGKALGGQRREGRHGRRKMKRSAKAVWPSTSSRCHGDSVDGCAPTTHK